MKFIALGIALAALCLFVGCGGEVASEPPATTAAAPQPPAPTPPGRTAPEGEVEIVATEESNLSPAPQPAAEMPAEPIATESDVLASDADTGTIVPAQVGVGAKGRDYGGPGIVTTPVETYFRTGERIAFEIQIPSAMKLYKASHDNKGPKTHEEFMKVIIQENGVQLPELPDGEEFIYDPKTEQLMVRHPAANQ